MIKEILHDSRFTDRTTFELMNQLDGRKGIVFGAGELSRMKRKVLMNIMRQVGVGKSVFVLGVEEETLAIMNHLDEAKSAEIDLQLILGYATNNIISKLLFNTSYEYGNEEFLGIFRRLERRFILLNPTQWMWVLPYSLAKHFSKTKELLRIHQEMLQEAKESYGKRASLMEKDGLKEPECVADFLWKQFHDKDPKEYPFPEDHIPIVLVDLLTAGQETTTTSLSWAFLHMIHKPDVQQKVADELVREFPDMGTLITLADMSSCPFTQATLNEIQRWTPITFSSLEHAALETVENFHGYRIPKGTRMMPNFLVMYRDPNNWKFPNEFNPHNFLDEEDNYVKSPFLIPFAIGTRSCPGENIAKIEMFVMFANIMRRFQLHSVQEEVSMNPRATLLVAPPHYKVWLTRRDA